MIHSFLLFKLNFNSMKISYKIDKRIKVSLSYIKHLLLSMKIKTIKKEGT